MHKVIIPLFLFSSLTFADTNNQSQMATINAILDYMNKSNLVTDDPNCESCSTPEDFYNSCYRNICSLSAIPMTADKYKEILLSTVPVNDIAQSEAAFLKAISPFVKIRLEAEINDLDQIIAQLETGEIPVISSEIKNTVPFFITPITNPDASVIPKDLIEHSNKATKILLTVVAKNRDYQMRQADSLTYFEKTYEGQAIADILANESKMYKERVANLKKTLNTNSTYLNEMIENLIAQDIINKADGGLELSSEEMNKLVSAVGLIDLLTNLFSDEDYRKLVSRFPYESLLNMLKTPKFLAKTKILREKLIELKNPEKLQNTLELCTNSFASNYFGLPTKAEKINFEKVILDAKRNISANIFPKLSQHSQGVMSPLVRNISFELPPTPSEALINLDEKSKLNVASEKADNIRVSKHVNENLEANLLGDAFDIAQFDPNSDSYIVEELLGLDCDDYASRHLRDAAHTSIGRIQVGWAGIKNPDAGKAVLYHEIGHVMSEAFKSKDMSKETQKTYQDIKSCLTNVNPNTHGDATDSYIDKVTEVETTIPISAYAEEDFADLISGIMVKSSDRATNLNVACFLHNEFDGNEISLVSHKDKSSDTHSPTFYRLLHLEQLQYGKLPVSCEKYMKKVGDTKTFTNCWELATAK